MSIIESLKKMNKWKAFAILVIIFFALPLAGRVLFIDTHRFELTKEQQERTESAARNAFKESLTSDFKSFIPNSGMNMNTGNGTKKVAFVSFASNNSSFVALVDLDTYEVVSVSKTHYMGWMEQRSRPEFWAHERFFPR